MAHILTANRLSDGRIVYHDANGGWTEDLDGGRLFGDDERDQAESIGRRDEAGLEVVGAYLFPVEAEGSEIRPLSVRERIRASGGPTIVPPVDGSAGFAVAAE